MAKKDKKASASTAMEASQNSVFNVQDEDEKYNSIVRNKKTIKDLIAPSGIDTSNLNHIAIMSSITRYARSHYVSGLPRMATFPYFLRAMYNFGDINTSVFINPISEATSQNNLNKIIVSLESERIVAGLEELTQSEQKKPKKFKDDSPKHSKKGKKMNK